MSAPQLPVHFIPLAQSVYHQWRFLLKSHGILYMYNIFGTGKSTQALAFAQSYFKAHLYFSVSDGDFMPQLTQFFATFKKGRANTLVIIDDLQWLDQPDDQQQLFALLGQQATFDHSLQILLLSRGRLPSYLLPLRINQRLAVANPEDLLLSDSGMEACFAKEVPLSHLSQSQRNDLVQHCASVTHGHAMAVMVYLQRICETPHDELTAAALADEDLFYQLQSQIYPQWPQAHREAIIALGVFPSFTLEMAQLVLGDQAQQLLDDFMRMDCFLRFQAPNTYHFGPLAAKFIAHKLTLLPPQRRQELYQTAAQYYEQQRDFPQALRCYHLANRIDKIQALVVYLLENAEGCVFAQLSSDYIHLLTPEHEAQNPSIIGAKAMLCAYQMKPEESKHYLAQLKTLAQDSQQPNHYQIMEVYIRTLIASPCVTADALKDNLALCSGYIKSQGITLKHVMPTGNFPSAINGGLDLLSWVPHKTVLYPLMKAAITAALGVEGVGVADAAMGEALYQQGKSAQAIAYLTQALSDANFKGSIRVQYTTTAIMAQLFQSEGQLDTAQEILQNIYEKAQQRNYNELLPNIATSLLHCALLGNDTAAIGQWLQTDAPNEHDPFYTTVRFSLFVKAQAYAALGRDLEALFILDGLQTYAALYHRAFLNIELLILRAIILFRRNEDWQAPLLQAVTSSSDYGLIHVLADQGAALLPLWKKMDWSQHSIAPRYLSQVGKGLKVMAQRYPKYLQAPVVSHIMLSSKERKVLQLMAAGQSNAQIAQSMDFTRSTAKFHISNIMKKLGVDNRTAAVTAANELQLI